MAGGAAWRGDRCGASSGRSEAVGKWRSSAWHCSRSQPAPRRQPGVRQAGDAAYGRGHYAEESGALLPEFLCHPPPENELAIVERGVAPVGAPHENVVG